MFYHLVEDQSINAEFKMRHNKKVNHLGRKSGHRKAMLANMASSLIMHKRIKTTVAKAKALRTYVEPLITKSKEDSTHSRRIVFGYLQNKDAVSELFREISPKIMERPGGYTRIFKTGTRVGDSAEMCIMELVDYNENLLAAKTDTGTKAGRRRRRGSRKKEEAETKAVKAKTPVSPAEQVQETGEEEITETEKAEETESSVESGETAEDETIESADTTEEKESSISSETAEDKAPQSEEEEKQSDEADEEKKE